ncbi:MAG: hypothetical protein HRT67_13300, partial [Flavobacteriaceae bacterium]|nr:hypothetical protein [Flavobacteriaceae bacterium]
KWTEGFPTVPVKDLVIHPREHDLVIGTFGRAAWVLDDIRPLRAIAKNKAILKQNLELFEPPIAYQVAYQQPTGSRFGGDALYNGENRNYGAIISYYIGLDNIEELSDEKHSKINDFDHKKTPVSETKAPKIKWDSIKLKIYDGERLIRTLKRKAPKTSGIYKWVWRMDEKGADRPSRLIQKRKHEPGGIAVKPGKYKIVMSFGNQTSENMVTVASDPRINVNKNTIDEIYSTLKEIQDMRQITADAVKQLVESKTIAYDYSQTLANINETAFKDHIKTSKDMVEKINKLIAIYLGKEDERQGITRNSQANVSQRIGTANRYVASRQNGITSTERRLLKHAKDDLKSALDQTNAFYKEEWNSYKTTMESLDISPFKDTTTFTID